MTYSQDWKVGWGRTGRPKDAPELDGVHPGKVRTREIAFARAGILAHLAGASVTVTNLTTGKRYRVDHKGNVNG